MSARIASLILAAGLSRRWGADNKLAVSIDGKPMAARTADIVLGASARPVIVVLGHEADLVRSALAGWPSTFVTAADYATGMAASLKAGIEAVPADCDGALVCLGDMPWLQSATLDYLAASFDLGGPDMALVPTYRGKWGNPMLL